MLVEKSRKTYQSKAVQLFCKTTAKKKRMKIEFNKTQRRNEMFRRCENFQHVQGLPAQHSRGKAVGLVGRHRQEQIRFEGDENSKVSLCLLFLHT